MIVIVFFFFQFFPFHHFKKACICNLVTNHKHTEASNTEFHALQVFSATLHVGQNDRLVTLVSKLLVRVSYVVMIFYRPYFIDDKLVTKYHTESCTNDVTCVLFQSPKWACHFYFIFTWQKFLRTIIHPCWNKIKAYMYKCVCWCVILPFTWHVFYRPQDLAQVFRSFEVWVDFWGRDWNKVKFLPICFSFKIKIKNNNMWLVKDGSPFLSGDYWENKLVLIFDCIHLSNKNYLTFCLQGQLLYFISVHSFKCKKQKKLNNFFFMEIICQVTSLLS